MTAIERFFAAIIAVVFFAVIFGPLASMGYTIVSRAYGAEIKKETDPVEKISREMVNERGFVLAKLTR